MKPWVRGLIGVVVAALVIQSCLFVVDVTEFAVITRLGKLRGVVLAEERGLHWKLPAPIETVTTLDARLQVLDLPQAEYLTNDKTNVTIETYCVWRIHDPLAFLQSVGTVKGAEARLGIVIGSELGAALGSVPFVQLVSTDPKEHRLGDVLASITQSAATQATRYGVEVLDVRIKRLNFPDQNQSSVFDRMRAERDRIAKRFRSEGEEESLKIRAEADQEKSRILAEARAEAERVRGQGEAEATRIFGEALAKDPEFYRYLRTLQAYRKILDPQTTLVLPGDSELMRLLTRGQAAETPRSAGKQP
ncbi:MAG: protease modulator HflC [bacterium]